MGWFLFPVVELRPILIQGSVLQWALDPWGLSSIILDPSPPEKAVLG